MIGGAQAVKFPDRARQEAIRNSSRSRHQPSQARRNKVSAALLGAGQFRRQQAADAEQPRLDVNARLRAAPPSAAWFPPAFAWARHYVCSPALETTVPRAPVPSRRRGRGASSCAALFCKPHPGGGPQQPASGLVRLGKFAQRRGTFAAQLCRSRQLCSSDKASSPSGASSTILQRQSGGVSGLGRLGRLSQSTWRMTPLKPGFGRARAPASRCGRRSTSTSPDAAARRRIAAPPRKSGPPSMLKKPGCNTRTAGRRRSGAGPGGGVDAARWIATSVRWAGPAGRPARGTWRSGRWPPAAGHKNSPSAKSCTRCFCLVGTESQARE